MKQESIPPFLGIVGDKKWSPFLDLGIPSPIFFAPKITENGRFRVQKNGTFSTQDSGVVEMMMMTYGDVM